MRLLVMRKRRIVRRRVSQHTTTFHSRRRDSAPTHTRKGRDADISRNGIADVCLAQVLLMTNA